MAGRPKGPAESDEDRLRRLTREAHEAVQEAREAVRAIRAEREAAERALADFRAAEAGSRQVLADFLSQAVSMAVKAGESKLGEIVTEAVEHLQAQTNQVNEHLLELLGGADVQGLVESIVVRTSTSLARQLIVTMNDGQPMIMPRPPGQPRHPADKGVYVTNDPDLAPPGSVVYDLR